MSQKVRSWIHRLMLNPYYEQAITSHKNTTGFGDTYSLLNALNEFYYQEGHMSEKGYQYNKKRYSSTLIEDFEGNVTVTPLTMSEVSQREKDAEMITTLKNVFAQWDSMKESSKIYHIKKAKGFPDFAISQKIIARAIEEGFITDGDHDTQVQDLSPHPELSVIQYTCTV